MHRRILSLFFFVAGSFAALATVRAAPVAKIKEVKYTYALRPLVLDGSASTAGAGVTYQWTMKGEGAMPAIENAALPVARFTPPRWGNQHFVLTVTEGAETSTAKRTILALNDPQRDDSPVFAGAEKIAYKQAADALGGMATLYLHVFKPADWKPSDRRAVVMLFHGGGWNGGSPAYYERDARYWASRGAVGITAQYRLGQREGVQPQDCVADARSAVRYLRTHAAELGIDARKIAVGGESAGAHLAASAGTLPAYDDPRDDLAVSCTPDALLLYFPYEMITKRGNRKDDMSPLNFVGPATPPTLFIGGENDGIAPAERGIEWGEKIKSADGERFRLFIYRSAHHPSGKPDMNKPGVENDLVRQTDLFLASLGFIHGAPTVTPMNAEAIAALHVAPADFKPVRKNTH